MIKAKNIFEMTNFMATLLNHVVPTGAIKTMHIFAKLGVQRPARICMALGVPQSPEGLSKRLALAIFLYLRESADA